MKENKLLILSVLLSICAVPDAAAQNQCLNYCSPREALEEVADCIDSRDLNLIGYAPEG